MMMTISGAIYRGWGGRLLDLITVHYVISGRRSRFLAFQGITQNLRWQMIDHSFPGKSKASQNKWLPWESLQASQVSQSHSGQSRPQKASAVFGSVVLLMVLALVLLLLTSAARVTILLVQGVMGQRRRPCVAPSSPPLNGPADILILAGKTKILIHVNWQVRNFGKQKYWLFQLVCVLFNRISSDKVRGLREGFKKSKWKFKMAFAMKGEGGRDRSWVPHTYFEKWFLLETI